MREVRGTIVRHATLGLAALLIACLPAQAEVLYRWTQYVPGGLEARAITDGSACPEVRIDARPVSMRVRSEPAQDYPIRVCAVTIPGGATSALVDGHPVPLPKPRADHILVIGDTGCRITSLINQACNDPAQWPFGGGARIEAEQHPDVIVHVGDFHYREAPCRLGNTGCAGSPFGDTWAVWEADFFSPARPLLEAAPLVMVRGNHEECERGGKGWSRTLDPYALVSPSGCLGLGDPFTVDLGGLTLVVMDVSTADEGKPSPVQVAHFRAQFESIARLAPQGPVWLTFHRPIWAAAAAVFGFVAGQNETLAAAAHTAIPDRVQAILSGHIHTFQVLGYKEDLPVQLVSGHAGDELHWTAPNQVQGLHIGGVTVAAGLGRSSVFGFVTLERDGSAWRIDNHAMTGDVLDRCRFEGRVLACDGQTSPGAPVQRDPEPKGSP